MSAPRGVALINALVLVAGISALSVAVLARLDQGVSRLSEMRLHDQTALYLKAGQVLAGQMLSSPPDMPLDEAVRAHLDQGWTTPMLDEQIDNGRLDLSISDLQGRFNLAWLMLEDEIEAVDDDDSPPELLIEPRLRAALDRLLTELGLERGVQRRLSQAVDPLLDQRVGAWGRTTRPPPLPLTGLDRLRLVEGLDEAALATLRPHVTSLPNAIGPNIDTLTPEVMAALIGPPAQAASLERELATVRPFESREDAFDWLEERFGAETAAFFGLLGADVTSNWFEAWIVARSDAPRRAELDSVRLVQRVMLERRDPYACCDALISVSDPQ
jgi:type II secretory pathway component PulK